jgi:hypothetical protein
MIDLHFALVLMIFGVVFFIDGFADQSNFKMLFGGLLISLSTVLIG